MTDVVLACRQLSVDDQRVDQRVVLQLAWSVTASTIRTVEIDESGEFALVRVTPPSWMRCRTSCAATHQMPNRGDCGTDVITKQS